MKKIMIDPGHGGKDPRAVGNSLHEKNVVLTISKLIRDILVNEYEGVEVRLTRETDVFHELAERAKMANDWRRLLPFCPYQRSWLSPISINLNRLQVQLHKQSSTPKS